MLGRTPRHLFPAGVTHQRESVDGAFGKAPAAEAAGLCVSIAEESAGISSLCHCYTGAGSSRVLYNIRFCLSRVSYLCFLCWVRAVSAPVLVLLISARMYTAQGECGCETPLAVSLCRGRKSSANLLAYGSECAYPTVAIPIGDGE